MVMRIIIIGYMANGLELDGQFISGDQERGLKESPGDGEGGYHGDWKRDINWARGVGWQDERDGEMTL